jgi:hypothetical protein
MSLETAASHRSLAELTQRFEQLAAIPRTPGKLQMIVLRTAPNERSCPLFAELSVEQGVVGDRWWGSNRTRDAQVTLMDVRASLAIAERVDWPLFGDNFIVDLDLDEQSVKAGRVLTLGEARLEITDEPHLGCKKFSTRFGAEALAWVNDKARRELRLRGIHARVLAPGRVHVGDSCTWAA